MIYLRSKAVGIYSSLLAILIAGCSQQPQQRTVDRGFYYWKSIAGLNAAEQQVLQQQKVGRLYLKFFDVTWNPQQQQAMPVAKLRFTEASRQFFRTSGMAIIPTVFITNETMQQLNATDLPTLAGQIGALLEGMIRQDSLENIREIQFDCDWTAGTKDNYFTLLRLLQEQPVTRQRTVSATIRLYQCKFRDRTGVPPVPRGLLMCYNMGNLKDPRTSNSILDPEELKKYIGNLRPYPLPLDIGLPLFEWKVLYRRQLYTGLLQDLPDSLLKPAFAAAGPNHTWQLLQDTLLAQYDLKKGDLIRQEQPTFAAITQAASLLSPQLPDNRFSVVLFHLDSLTLTNFSSHELEEMYNSLH
ncbi:MAG: hypothetical protein P0Y53_07650 [Candidatus Pseudobacter hemicellulosilyticus]|uniref:Uncharacterized protein n=1 Tax=Candidatus Pseudobacter hemicellulosilyticus TaxID=3121375 RepID=A0AAJ6BJG6_9BACT|nr:MAG: hypothetical protein P0Y53_07650 [Pseudobacter sp.]